MKNLKWSLLAVFGIVTLACTKDKQEEEIENIECATTISFSSDIQTIMSTSCATSGCHNSAVGAAGFILESHSQISDNATIILNVIRHEPGFAAMPQGGAKLSDAQIDEFTCWIQQGKLNN